MDTPPARVAAARAKLQEAETKAAEDGSEPGAATAKLNTARRRLQEEEGKGITKADEGTRPRHSGKRGARWRPRRNVQAVQPSTRRFKS